MKSMKSSMKTTNFWIYGNMAVAFCSLEYECKHFLLLFWNIFSYFEKDPPSFKGGSPLNDAL